MKYLDKIALPLLRLFFHLKSYFHEDLISLSHVLKNILYKSQL